MLTFDKKKHAPAHYRARSAFPSGTAIVRLFGPSAHVKHRVGLRRLCETWKVDEDLEGSLHHVELWVPNLERAKDEWGWMLTRLGYSPDQNWDQGISWRRGTTYIVAEESPALTSREHQRTAPGLNHLAFHAGSEEKVDALTADSQLHGWQPLFAEKYPHAGGPENYAAYLVNSDGFEVELIATK